jgi:hypothetical protein
MASSRALFSILVERLARRARLDLCIRRSVAGLFFGLLPCVVVSLLAGSVTLPIPALTLAVGMAAAGCAAGLVSALLGTVDRRRLLITADKSLGSRELAGTAFELADSAGPGIFADAVIEDAVKLLARNPPRTILGRPRLPLAPLAVLAALVAAAGFLFPFDLRGLFRDRPAPDSELAQIGEDLRNRGLRLAEESRSHDLARSLALSQQLAQLGSDLAANRILKEDALDRMSELESGLAEEYQLRTQEVQGQAGTSPDSGTARKGGGDAGSAPGGAGSAAGDTTSGLSDAESALGDALDRLRQAERQLNGQGPGDGAQASRPRRQRNPSEPQAGSQEAPPGLGGSDQPARNGRNQGSESNGAGPGAEDPGHSGQSGGSGVGSLPAPVKRGAPSAIIDNTRGPGLQVQANPSEGESTRLLARSLPRWTGSRLPEEAIITRYSRQAESALARDEIPLKLRESVKEYLTVIGISK